MLSIVCIGAELALVLPGPAGQTDFALWGFLLAPLGGIPAFLIGSVGLTAQPTPRCALLQFVSGTLALGLPSILSAAAVALGGRRYVAQWFFSIPLLFAPVLGWIVLAMGLGMIRRGNNRAKAVVTTGTVLASVPWLFGLWVVYYITFIDD